MIARAVREPFLHFVVLGALLFGMGEYLQGRAGFSRITVTRDEVARIITNYQLQYGVAPTGQQLQALTDQFVHEEMFYREAQRVGLDKNDEIIRRRLVQKYEFLQQDLSIPEQPGPTQLLNYFRDHTAQYQIPARITFTQVYFSPDRLGLDGAHEAAQRLRVQLLRSGANRASIQGDAFPGPSDYSALTQPDIARVFGSGELTAQIFNLPLGVWSPPLRSGLGWHLVYVSAVQATRNPLFEEVAEKVRRDYLAAQSERRNAASLARLAQGFTIVHE
jgi:peptidyl-prolyl cis-trans isomerase C